MRTVRQSVPGTVAKKGTDYSLSPFSERGQTPFGFGWISEELAELKTKNLFSAATLGSLPRNDG
ncbi:MAG: hypothetical protein HYS55_05005 [Candidatus Omnitrophica bacterium]|nr:hypothetical protein [Candidatus Omnitrophota bacterium]